MAKAKQQFSEEINISPQEITETGAGVVEAALPEIKKKIEEVAKQNALAQGQEMIAQQAAQQAAALLAAQEAEDQEVIDSLGAEDNEELPPIPSETAEPPPIPGNGEEPPPLPDNSSAKAPVGQENSPASSSAPKNNKKAGQPNSPASGSKKEDEAAKAQTGDEPPPIPGNGEEPPPLPADSSAEAPLGQENGPTTPETPENDNAAGEPETPASGQEEPEKKGEGEPKTPERSGATQMINRLRYAKEIKQLKQTSEQLTAQKNTLAGQRQAALKKFIEPLEKEIKKLKAQKNSIKRKFWLMIIIGLLFTFGAILAAWPELRQWEKRKIKEIDNEINRQEEEKKTLTGKHLKPLDNQIKNLDANIKKTSADLRQLINTSLINSQK